MLVLHCTTYLHVSDVCMCVIPYTEKLSRGETFVVFTVFHPTANVLQRIVNSHRHSLLRDAATANFFP